MKQLEIYFEPELMVSLLDHPQFVPLKETATLVDYNLQNNQKIYAESKEQPKEPKNEEEDKTL